MSLNIDPFEWLQTVEALAKQKAVGLPSQKKIKRYWRGIAFRVGETFFITPLDEVREVLHYPKIMAKVPGAKPWVQGIANIRGLLLPVIDLRACLDHTPTAISKQSRLLITNQSDISSGILVDEVLGIKDFLENHRNLDQRFGQAWFASFARGAFVEKNHHWVVFDMQALTKNRLFLDAALAA
jgi:twitching motility protein PilI